MSLGHKSRSVTHVSFKDDSGDGEQAGSAANPRNRSLSSSGLHIAGTGTRRTHSPGSPPSGSSNQRRPRKQKVKLGLETDTTHMIDFHSMEIGGEDAIGTGERPPGLDTMPSARSEVSVVRVSPRPPSPATTTAGATEATAEVPSTASLPPGDPAMQSLADRIANMRSPLGSSATKTKLAVDPSLDMDLTHTADGSIKISPAHSMRDINNRETSRSGTPVLAEEEKGDREGGDDLTLQATPTQESIKAPALPTVLSHGAVQADLVYDRQALAAMPPHALDNIVDGLSERMADLNLCLVKFLATRDELAAERDKLEDKLAEVLSEVNEATEKDAEAHMAKVRKEEERKERKNKSSGFKLWKSSTKSSKPTVSEEEQTTSAS